MNIKKYFTGKTGCLFWLNILLVIIVIIAIPVVSYMMLGSYTHHGEKIEVPNVIGKHYLEAENMLEDSKLSFAIIDSVYQKKAKPNSVLNQSPVPGSTVKSGHQIYLTINMKSEPKVKLPDLNSSRRELEAKLQALGVKMGSPKFVNGQPKDLVIGIRQGSKNLHGGDMIEKNRPVTLVCGGGLDEEDIDTMSVDTMNVTYNFDTEGSFIRKYEFDKVQ